MMKACAVNLGCKVNEYESQSILMQLKTSGYKIVQWPDVADIYIVNTCAVTNTGERKSRQFLTKIEKINPNAKIVVCGCAVQNNPSNFLNNKNIIALAGNNGKHLIKDLIFKQQKELLDLPNDYIEMTKPLKTNTRQYIKIQDGCNNFCSYCIIPYLRGRSRSRSLSNIIDEIKQTKAKEVVLTGIDMSDYRIDGQRGLKTLISEVVKLDKRFRISSLECSVIDKQLIEILASSKNFCGHFHLSLQSACNETLKRMNRHYTIEQFMSKVKLIRKYFPDASVSTDIIVGFKGETDEEFNETFENIKQIKFSFMHIFPYSERKGTNACKLKMDLVPSSIIKQREKQLIDLDKSFRENFYRENINTVRPVLIEEVENGISKGYTDNYIYVNINKKLKVGTVKNVKLTELGSGFMFGE